MFHDFKNFLSGNTTLKAEVDGSPTPREMQIAIVAVLLETAHHDSTFLPEEVTELVRVMNRAFGLSDVDVGELMEVGSILRKDPEKIRQFVDAINMHFTAEQRQLILAMLWKLVKADGRIEKVEQQFAIKLRTMLQLSLEQAMRAQQMAENDEV